MKSSNHEFKRSYYNQFSDIKVSINLTKTITGSYCRFSCVTPSCLAVGWWPSSRQVCSAGLVIFILGGLRRAGSAGVAKILYIELSVLSHLISPLWLPTIFALKINHSHWTMCETHLAKIWRLRYWTHWGWFCLLLNKTNKLLNSVCQEWNQNN